MWGCTGALDVLAKEYLVVPTHVGVYREQDKLSNESKCCPHACGGVPKKGPYTTK